MIRIKAVDAQNLLDVCALSAKQDGVGAKRAGHFCCNAVCIAEAKYHPEMHPNAIYHNHGLIGFFLYERAENHPDTATICRFMIDDRFQHRGLEAEALAHILRGLKIQGVRKAVLLIDQTNEAAKELYLSFGFRFTGKLDKAGAYYELEL